MASNYVVQLAILEAVLLNKTVYLVLSALNNNGNGIHLALKYHINIYLQC